MLKKQSWQRDQKLNAWLLLLPALIFLIAIALVPLISLFKYSMMRFNLFQADRAYFVGLSNFAWILKQSMFWISLYNHFILLIVSVSAEMVFGALLALLMFRALRGIGVARTLLSTPILIAPIVAAIIWRYLYQPHFGVINFVLRRLGLPAPLWLADPNLALWSVIAVEVWQWTPFVFLILLAGLHNMPKSILEAAEIDGANKVQIFFHIVLPLMKRIILVALLLRLIDGMRAFDIVIGTTQGGPGTATFTLPFYIWRVAFTTFEIGDASAISLLLLVVIVVLINFIVKLLAREGTTGISSTQDV